MIDENCSDDHDFLIAYCVSEWLEGDPKPKCVSIWVCSCSILIFKVMSNVQSQIVKLSFLPTFWFFISFMDQICSKCEKFWYKLLSPALGLTSIFLQIVKVTSKYSVELKRSSKKIEKKNLTLCDQVGNHNGGHIAAFKFTDVSLKVLNDSVIFDTLLGRYFYAESNYRLSRNGFRFKKFKKFIFYQLSIRNWFLWKKEKKFINFSCLQLHFLFHLRGDMGLEWIFFSILYAGSFLAWRSSLYS